MWDDQTVQQTAGQMVQLTAGLRAGQMVPTTVDQTASLMADCAVVTMVDHSAQKMADYWVAMMAGTKVAMKGDWMAAQMAQMSADSLVVPMVVRKAAMTVYCSVGY